MSFPLPTSLLYKHEVYRTFKSLRYQFLIFNNTDFIGEGPQKLAIFLLAVIERIIYRIEHDKYDTKAFGWLVIILPQFQLWCTLMNNAKTPDITWSIIPSLEDLFTKFSKKCFFVFSTTWDRNYSIHLESPIRVLKTVAYRIDGLFDDTHKDSLSFLNKLCKKLACENIYFIIYPRVKRLSAVHFSILGHELGHLAYNEWEKDKLKSFLRKSNIESKFDEYIENKHDATPGSLFHRNYFDKYLISIVMCLREICCDIVGNIVFGHSFLLSLYKFSSIYEQSEHMINNGYYSWYYRMQTSLKTLKRIEVKYSEKYLNNIARWMESIEQITEKHDLVKDLKDTDFEYHKFLIEGIEINFDHIFNELSDIVSEMGYDKIFDERQINEVKDLLREGIVPAASIAPDLLYEPLDMRNIISGTWLHLIENAKEDMNLIEYYSISSQANKLALKGIDLSRILKEFKERK